MTDVETSAVPVATTTRAPRVAGTVALIGLAVFVGGFALMHFIQHDVDPIVNFGSDYAFGDQGWIMRLAFVGLAAAAAALAGGVAQALAPSRPRTVAIVALAAVTVGMLASAAFNADPPRPDGTTGYTTEGALHDLAGIVAFLGMIVAAIALNRAIRRDDTWHRAQTVTRVIAWSMPIGLVAMLVVAESSTPGTDGYTGLAQRLFLLLPLTGATLLAARLRRTGSPT